MAKYLTSTTTTCNYKIPLMDFGQIRELIYQTGINEKRRDGAAAISDYVEEKYLNKEPLFEESKLEIKRTSKKHLVISVTNLDKNKMDKYVSSNKIPNETELYDDMLAKIVMNGIRAYCTDKVFEKFTEI